MMDGLAPLTAWDYAVLAILISSIVFGLLRGFVRTVFGLAAWFIATLVALFGGPGLMVSLQVGLPLPFFMFLVFLAVFLVTRVVGSLIARGLAWVGLGGVDRVLGGVFGMLRAGIILIVIVLAASMFDLHREPAWERALSRPLLEEILARFADLLPDRVPALKRVLEI
jgi:membrane protein required for colicin V production